MDTSFWMNQDAKYAAYKIGDWTYGQPEVKTFGDDTTLVVGKFCSIADGVRIFLGGNHRPDWITTYPFNVLLEGAEIFKGHPATKGNVVIGHDVWIGADAFILSGVSVGTGAVIGARSVVSKDVAPYSITVGNPARHIKFRFDESTVAKLIQMAWWDWPIAKILVAMPLMLSGNADEFIGKYGSIKQSEGFL